MSARSTILKVMIRLIFEAGHLHRTPRTGWLVAGIANPESVAEQSHGAAVIEKITSLGVQ